MSLAHVFRPFVSDTSDLKLRVHTSPAASESIADQVTSAVLSRKSPRDVRRLLDRMVGVQKRAPVAGCDLMVRARALGEFIAEDSILQSHYRRDVVNRIQRLRELGRYVPERADKLPRDLVRLAAKKYHARYHRTGEGWETVFNSQVQADVCRHLRVQAEKTD